MQNRAYRFRCNGDRDKHHQLSNFQPRRFDPDHDCCHEGDRRSNHRGFNSRNKRQSDRYQNRHRNRFTQPFSNRGGW